jgi:glycerol-3-phosphate dehydrogenase
VRRDPRELANRSFDLLVVGAGIYGAAAAWDATLRGWSVALIDRGDIGSGTSFHNAKTIHGGVRSLQRGRIAEVREYVRERRTLSRLLPHLVHPQPFVIPTTRSPRQHWLPLGAYFALHDIVAFDRNNSVDPERQLATSRLVSREECLRIHPFVDPATVTGGLVWHDCQMYNSDRVTLAFARSAAERGAVVANYVEAASLLRDGTRVHGAALRDVLTGETFDVRASVVLLAVGPWTEVLLRSLAPGHRTVFPALSRAMNVVFNPVVGSHALGGSARGRYFFLAPWRQVTIGGTSHDPHHDSPDHLTATAATVQPLIDDLRAAFPGLTLGIDDLRLVHRGLLPASRVDGDDVTLLRASPIRDHRADGYEGLVSMTGVRYTTARHTAERAIDRAFACTGTVPPPSTSATTPLDGGEIPDYAAFVVTSSGPSPAGVPAESAQRVMRSYGTRQAEVRALWTKDAALARPLSSSCAVTRGEVLYAAREEMAMTLADAVLRRTEAGSAGHPGRDALEAAADILAEVQQWPPTRTAEEIRRVEEAYRLHQ